MPSQVSPMQHYVDPEQNKYSVSSVCKRDYNSNGKSKCFGAEQSKSSCKGDDGLLKSRWWWPLAYGLLPQVVPPPLGN